MLNLSPTYLVISFIILFVIFLVWKIILKEKAKPKLPPSPDMKEILDMPYAILGKLADRLPEKCSWDDALKKINSARVVSAQKVASEEIDSSEREKTRNKLLLVLLLFFLSLSAYKITIIYQTHLKISDVSWVKIIFSVLFANSLYSLVFWIFIIAIEKWYFYIKIFGRPTFKNIKRSLRFRDAKLIINFLISASVLLFIWYYSTKSLISFSIFILVFSLSLWAFIMYSMPPIAFFLSNTKQENLIFYEKIKKLLNPLETIACFFPSVNGEKSGIFIDTSDKTLKLPKLHEFAQRIPTFSYFNIYDLRNIDISLIKELSLIFLNQSKEKTLLLIDSNDKKQFFDQTISEINPEFQYRYVKENELLSQFTLKEFGLK